ADRLGFATQGQRVLTVPDAGGVGDEHIALATSLPPYDAFPIGDAGTVVDDHITLALVTDVEAPGIIHRADPDDDKTFTGGCFANYDIAGCGCGSIARREEPPCPIAPTTSRSRLIIVPLLLTMPIPETLVPSVTLPVVSALASVPMTNVPFPCSPTIMVPPVVRLLVFLSVIAPMPAAFSPMAVFPVTVIVAAPLLLTVPWPDSPTVKFRPTVTVPLLVNSPSASKPTMKFPTAVTVPPVFANTPCALWPTVMSPS